MTTPPSSISIYITFHGDTPVVDIRPGRVTPNRAALAMPQANTFTMPATVVTYGVRPCLSARDGSGGPPTSLPLEVQALWGAFQTCVNGRTVDSQPDLARINDQIGRLFHGPMHASGADYLRGGAGQCVDAWLRSTGSALTFSGWPDPATTFSRSNGAGGWDYEQPGVQYAVRNGSGGIEAYMGIETTHPLPTK
jgi:hypothetical protein